MLNALATRNGYQPPTGMSLLVDTPVAPPKAPPNSEDQARYKVDYSNGLPDDLEDAID